VFFRSVLQLPVTVNVVPGSPILVILIMVTIHSSETSVLTSATTRNIPEDDILHCHRRENVKSYTALTGWTLYWKHSVSCEVRTGIYTPEDDILVVTAVKTSNLTQH
jgi:hypothetical protein